MATKDLKIATGKVTKTPKSLVVSTSALAAKKIDVSSTKDIASKTLLSSSVKETISKEVTTKAKETVEEKEKALVESLSTGEYFDAKPASEPETKEDAPVIPASPATDPDESGASQGAGNDVEEVAALVNAMTGKPAKAPAKEVAEPETQEEDAPDQKGTGEKIIDWFKEDKKRLIIVAAVVAVIGYLIYKRVKK